MLLGLCLLTPGRRPFRPWSVSFCWLLFFSSFFLCEWWDLPEPTRLGEVGRSGVGSDSGSGPRWTLHNLEKLQVHARYDQAALPVENEKDRVEKKWRRGQNKRWKCKIMEPATIVTNSCWHSTRTKRGCCECPPSRSPRGLGKRARTAEASHEMDSCKRVLQAVPASIEH